MLLLSAPYIQSWKIFSIKLPNQCRRCFIIVCWQQNCHFYYVENTKTSATSHRLWDYCLYRKDNFKHLYLEEAFIGLDKYWSAEPLLYGSPIMAVFSVLFWIIASAIRLWIYCLGLRSKVIVLVTMFKLLVESITTILVAYHWHEQLHVWHVG